MNEPLLMAHGGHAQHAAHLGFAIFCVLVVLFCVAAAKWTSPKPPVRH
jgi:hypothetical protein